MKRRKKKPEEEVGEGWLLPYSDMMTLLLALFIVLFSIAKVDSTKLKEVSSVFSEILSSKGGSSISNSDTTIDNVIDLGTTPKKGNGSSATSSTSSSSVVTIQEAQSQESQVKTQMSQTETFNQVTQDVQQEMENAGISGNSSAKLKSDGLHITLDSNILFDSGKADLSSDVQNELKTLVPALQKISTYPVTIAGYTDNQPIVNVTTYPTNWELSSARAIAVMHFFVENGAFSEKHVSIQAYGENNPIASNKTATGRAKNRRVEIIIRKTKSN
ncbi:flagellar motor protein MotB [Ligilactobacillus sp. WILCCON 0076]|uniref:Flagellar motor protein MotB n=1 Tax=Ligilactobacillus ubinensis TaxID=2876789 RepID=A0A9X2FM16_9LACO|nr:flagellar motor protein MotB [Ligilactobacillus ubinensis]MCP0887825.1 flagellar motor protein MotB [Ligilactobacillus ubinensis]